MEQIIPQRSNPVSIQKYSLYTLKKDSIVSDIQFLLNAFVGLPDSISTWNKIKNRITDYLIQEWKKGILVGSKQSEAFFVRIDQTTMTQTDINAKKLVILVGLAMIKPSEFDVLRFEKQL